MAIDPVCGAEVDLRTVANKSDYQGKTYYFCCSGCKRDFDKEPQRFVIHQKHGAEHMHHH